MSARKNRKTYYISRRFDVRLGMEITADNFEQALATARAMQLTDFVEFSGATTYESAEDLHGLGVLEVDP